MASEEIYELAVRVTSDGIDETTKKLEGQGKAFEGAADMAAKQSNRLQEFASRWKGAMTVFTAGLAVAAAGLLSQVPVLGEVFSGFKAIIEAVTLQLDKRLRPTLGPIRDRMFELADAIARGDWGEVKSIITDFADALRTIDWSSLFNSVVSNLKGFLDEIGVIDLVENLLSGLPGFIDFAAGKLGSFLTKVIKLLPGGEMALSLGENIVDGMKRLKELASAATQRVREFLAEMTWDKIVQTIANGFISAASVLTTGLVNLVNAVDWRQVFDAFLSQMRNVINDAFGDIGGDVASFALSGSFSAIPMGGAIPGPVRQQGIAATEQQADRALQALREATVVHETNIDGRTVARSTEPYFGQGAANVGRVSRTR